MSGDGTESVSGAGRTVRAAVAWFALVAVAWAIAGFWGEFVRNQTATTLAVEQSAVASATAAAGVETTVTDLIATARVELVLRSQPDTSTAAVATAAQGSALEVVSRKGTWFRVKDVAGRVGWIPNDNDYISVRTK
jgi:SH3-like domain-containing protein